jgi:predicted nucleotide-binding protein
MNTESAAQLLQVLEKTISAGKLQIPAATGSVKNWRVFVNQHHDARVAFAKLLRFLCENVPTFCFPDQSELTAAQQFLEHAAQTNLVSHPR